MSDDVTDEIMNATFRALCDHGYAELTMQDIADETDKSKAALHYHYDSKQELLLAFLDYLYGRFTGRLADPAGETAIERLESLIDDVLHPPVEDDDLRVGFKTALLELKAQAPYDEEIREHLRQFDAFLNDQVRDLIAAGIEDGSIREVEPEETARFIVTTLDGAQTKRVAVGQDVEHIGRMLDAYVEQHLAADTRVREVAE